MKKIIALLLVFSFIFCFAACSSTDTEPAGDDEGTTAENPAEDAVDADSTDTDVEETVPDEIPAEAEEDVIAYLTDGLYNADTVIASTPYGEITMQDVMYQAAYEYMYIASMYSMYGMTLELTDDAGDGTTVADYLLNYGCSAAVDLLAAYSKAMEYGIALTDEENAALATIYEDNVQTGGESLWEYYVSSGIISEDDYDDDQKAEWISEHGAEYFEACMLAYGCTPDGYTSISEKYYYISELQDYLYGENGVNSMASGELASAVDAYVEDNGIIWGRCILFSTMDAADDAEIAEIASQAQDVYDSLSGLANDELSDAFTEMQTEYDVSGYTAGEVQYYSNTDGLVDGYYDGLASLEPGQVGITGQTDYGYFILLREEDNTADIEETVQDSYESEEYYALLDSWIEEYGLSVTDLAADLDSLALFEKVAELQTIVGSMDFS